MNTCDLIEFQRGFAAALLGRSTDLPAWIAEVAAQPAFAVYRNGVMKSAIDALQANYPAIVRLVGEEWFRAAAAEFVRLDPPASPMLVDYGIRFADFLRTFEPAGDLPYLPDVARLDRYWTQAHIASNARPLDGTTIAAMDQEALAAAVLVPHPAAQWQWFDAMPIYTLWRCNRTGEAIDDDLDWHGEGALITRPESDVVWQPLCAAGCAFLDACRAGETVSAATLAALAASPTVDLGALMCQLLTCGALQSIHPSTPDQEYR